MISFEGVFGRGDGEPFIDLFKIIIIINYN